MQLLIRYHLVSLSKLHGTNVVEANDRKNRINTENELRKTAIIGFRK